MTIQSIETLPILSKNDLIPAEHPSHEDNLQEFRHLHPLVADFPEILGRTTLYSLVDERTGVIPPHHFGVYMRAHRQANVTCALETLHKDIKNLRNLNTKYDQRPATTWLQTEIDALDFGALVEDDEYHQKMREANALAQTALKERRQRLSVSITDTIRSAQDGPLTLHPQVDHILKEYDRDPNEVKASTAKGKLYIVSGDKHRPLYASPFAGVAWVEDDRGLRLRVVVEDRNKRKGLLPRDLPVCRGVSATAE